jgi:electron transport complex protein RnfE
MSTDMKPATGAAWLALGLCPAIAVTDWTVHGFALAVTAVLACGVASLCHQVLKPLPLDVRWPVSVMVLVAFLSGITLVIDAWWHSLHASLSIFVLLFGANLAVHSEHLRPTSHARFTRQSLGLAAALLILGLVREAVGHGSLFHDAAPTLAAWLGSIDAQFFRADRGFLLSMLPPGAFIAAGLLLAVRNWWHQRPHESSKS